MFPALDLCSTHPAQRVVPTDSWIVTSRMRRTFSSLGNQFQGLEWRSSASFRARSDVGGMPFGRARCRPDPE